MNLPIPRFRPASMFHVTTEGLGRGGILPFYLAILACYGLYQLGLPGDFLLDDYSRVETINVPGTDWQSVVDATFSQSTGVLGRHFSYLTFALTDITSGPGPAAYKNHNILLHLLVACLQYWTLGRILSHSRFRNTISNPWLIASSIAILWMVHPLVVSTVLYSVQRMTILSALFCWIALLLYTVGRAALDDHHTVLGSLALLILVPACMTLGALSKESAVLIPVYLGLIEWFLFRRIPTPPAPALVARAGRLALIGLPILAGLILFVLYHERFLSTYDGRPFGLLERLATQSHVVWWYARIIFFPLLRDLSLYHDGFRIVGPDNIAALIAGMSLLVLFAVGLAIRRQAPLLGIGITMFLASHALESTILPLELVFEHRNYFGTPFLFLAAVGAWKLCPAGRRAPSVTGTSRLVPPVLLVAIFAWFSTQTGLRTWTWSDREMLTLLAVEEKPGSVRARVELANYYLRSQKYGAAISILDDIKSLDPSDSGASVHVLLVKCPSGEIDSAYADALSKIRNRRVTPYTIDGLQSLSEFLKRGHCKNLRLDQYHELMQVAIRNDTSSARPDYFLHDLTARTLSDFGYTDVAIRHAREAMKLSESAPISYRHRGFSLYARLAVKLGEIERARMALRELEKLSLDPRVSIDSDITAVQRLIQFAESNDSTPH